MDRIYGIWVKCGAYTGWDARDDQLFRTDNIGVARAQASVLRQTLRFLDSDAKCTVEVIGEDGRPQSAEEEIARERRRKAAADHIERVVQYHGGTPGDYVKRRKKVGTAPGATEEKMYIVASGADCVGLDGPTGNRTVYFLRFDNGRPSMDPDLSRATRMRKLEALDVIEHLRYTDFPGCLIRSAPGTSRHGGGNRAWAEKIDEEKQEFLNLIDDIAARERGAEFLREVRAIVRGCSRQETPAEAARLTATYLLAMVDGAGEYSGGQYKVVTEDDKPVKFCHREL